MSAAPIIVIADDLSGAAELAGIAFVHGLSAEAQTRFDPASAAEVIAVDTDSRGLVAEAAEARVCAVAAEVIRVRPAWIFKKVDSVLRGQPRVEIAAVLRATGQARAVLAPANPSRGRTILQGQYFIGGVPLDQTPFAEDPEHPRRSADVFQLLGGRDDFIGVPNVSSGADLERLAQSIDDRTLAAGAADFFAAILANRGHALSVAETVAPPIGGPAVLVCGSLAAWRDRQTESAAAGLQVLLADAIADDVRGIALTELRPHGSVVLAVGDEGATPVGGGVAFDRFVADAAKFVLEWKPASVLIEGGATAAAVARHLDWTRFAVTYAAPAGVGALRPLAAEVAPLVLLKPGSYAWPPEIWRAFCAAGR